MTISLSVPAVGASVTTGGAGGGGPVVRTDLGPVRGVATGLTELYQGIPYAQPPTGVRRWRAPVRPRPWTAVRDASKPGPACAQLDETGGVAAHSSEDCLYLNVTRPRRNRAERRPVVVYLHGGAFSSGSGSDFDARRMAATGDVVVVTSCPARSIRCWPRPPIRSPSVIDTPSQPPWRRFTPHARPWRQPSGPTPRCAMGLVELGPVTPGMSAPDLRRCQIHSRKSMSLLKTIDRNPAFAPQESGPLPERLISGNPTYKTWAQDAAHGETIKTGVWEATPGETRSIKGELFEFCHILSGVIEITPEGGEPVVYKAGDSFVMKPGFVGVWKTIETVRKIYLTVS
ncbi:carboxylesterase family protein [Streptomyces sp. NPDC001401]|uniref:carboxylesterase family protein n=1 Tax=Streptomyces sp. NPDC001401 TaxID=3364570 RepID=UPI003693AF90